MADIQFCGVTVSTVLQENLWVAECLSERYFRLSTVLAALVGRRLMTTLKTSKIKLHNIFVLYLRKKNGVLI